MEPTPYSFISLTPLLGYSRCRISTYTLSTRSISIFMDLDGIDVLIRANSRNIASLDSHGISVGSWLSTAG